MKKTAFHRFDYRKIGTAQQEKLFQMRLSQNFSFWESNLKIRSFARLKA
jgi:hypothetical protein